LDNLQRSESEDIHHILLGDVRSAERHHLVEHALGIAQAAFGPAREGFGGGIVELDVLAFGDVEEVFLDKFRRDAAEVETLAAAGDGGGNFLRLGGGGSSSVLRSALKAPAESMWTSSIR